MYVDVNIKTSSLHRSNGHEHKQGLKSFFHARRDEMCRDGLMMFVESLQKNVNLICEEFYAFSL